MFKPRCKGCAFTAGTEANLSELTRLKTELCVEAYEPFYCHENAVGDEIPKGKEHLCRGWAEAVTGKKYPEEWKRQVALGLLKVLSEFETDPDATEEVITGAILSELTGQEIPW